MQKAIFTLSDVSGGVPETDTGTLTAGANHTLTATLLATQSDGSPSITSYLTLGTAATTAAITGTHSGTVIRQDGLSIPFSLTIAANGSLTCTFTNEFGTSSGNGYLDANNNVYVDFIGPSEGDIFVAALQAAGSALTISGKVYTTGEALSNSGSFSGTLN